MQEDASNGDDLTDKQLVHRARVRGVAALSALAALWIVSVGVGAFGAARSLPGYHPSTPRLLTGTAVILLSAGTVIVAGVRFIRRLAQQEPMPASSLAQRVRAMDRVRRGVPADRDDREPARALATRMASQRSRAFLVAAGAPMLVGAAILVPSVPLDTALVVNAVVATALAARLVHNAGRADRYLATTSAPR